MKKLIVVSALLASSLSFAAERNIWDLMYLPKAGTIFGQSELAYIDGNVDDKSFDEMTEVTGWGVAQTVGYSLSDKLLVTAELQYLKLDVDSTTDYEKSGISDPEILARYRVMEGEYVLDIVGGAEVSLGETETKSNNDSDNLNGGHILKAGAEFGSLAKYFQWTVAAQYARFLDGEADNAGTTEDIDAHNIWTFGGSLLTSLSESSFLKFTYAFQIEDSYDIENVKQAPTTAHNLGVQYQMLLNENVLGYVGYNFQSSNANGYDTNDYSFFSVGARYQF